MESKLEEKILVCLLNLAYLKKFKLKKFDRIVKKVQVSKQCQSWQSKPM